MDYNDAISSLIYWANLKGYIVSITRYGDDSVDSVSKIIEINSNNSVQTQLYVLLHECGHVLVTKNKSSIGIESVLSAYSEKTSIHKVFRVVEEVEAWKRGRALAERLGISVDQKKWDKYVARALKKYMYWASN